MERDFQLLLLLLPLSVAAVRRGQPSYCTLVLESMVDDARAKEVAILQVQDLSDMLCARIIGGQRSFHGI